MPHRVAHIASTPEGLIWPLVGRDEELQRIVAAHAAGDRSGVVLVAPAGVGKSRLAREAVTFAEQEGAYVRWVQATRSAASVPLGAVAGLLPDDVRTDDPLELIRRCADALAERAGGRPIVLGVDDAQLLDPTSAALVLHLTMSRAAFLVATLRTGEPCPDAVQSLWKDGGAARMEVSPLTEEQTVRLIEAALHGHVEQRVGQWVADSSRGNPLYVRELIAGALAAGALEERHGFWTLARRPPPSQSLSELIGARMTDLAEGERRAVELLALGEPLRLAEMVELAGTDALAAVESQGLVTLEEPGAAGDVRLAHPLYGEVIAASMGVVRASEARRRLAETLQAREGRSPDDSLRIARWLLDAGDPIPVPLLIEAADAAIRAGDPELGGRLAELALERDAGVRAAMLLARSWAVRMDHERAEAVLAGCEGTIESRELALQYLQQRSLDLTWGLQRPRDGLALLARARDWWPDQAWRRGLDPLRLHLVSMVDGFAGAVHVSEDILADPELEPAIRRRMELVHVTNLFYSGRVREARELLLGRLPAVPLRDEYDEFAMVMWCVIGLESGWDFERAGAWMSRALQDAVRANDHAAAGIAAATVGSLHLVAGRYDDARRWLTEADVHFEHRDPFQTRKCTRGSLVGVAYFTGDRDGAAAAIRRCREAIGDRELIDTDRAYVVRAEAWAALAEGDPPRAQQLLLDAAAELAGVPLYAAHLYHEALRAGAPARSLAGPLAEVHARCDARLVDAYADHVAARAAADGTALLRCAEEFADIGALRYATECAAAAAETFAADGREDSARRAATRSGELHVAGQGGVAPEIRGLDTGSVTLTPREAQLVELAGRGLSNAEIADRLVLSVRTVESHVYRAMQKLGVSDRRELAPTRQ